MADFRLCSTCLSHSQASLYHYIHQQISDLPELTIARLRYFLGGCRPSQTTHHALSTFTISVKNYKKKEKKKTVFQGRF